MATIRKRETSKGTTSYQVVWREPMRDDFGAPTGKLRQTSETFDTERKAKRRLRQIEEHLDSGRGVDPSSAKAKANRPLGFYAKQYLDSLAGLVDPTTVEGYEAIYRTHIGPVFGSRPVASITTADVMAFRAGVVGKRSASTVKHIIGTLKRVLDAAVDDQAIQSNPVMPGRRRRTSKTGEVPFKHRPLSANQVASVCDWIERNRSADPQPGQPSTGTVYALAILFTAHTGVRAAELQGLQVGDVTLSDIPGTAGAVRIVRTATPRNGQWITGTPKSAASTNRTVPLAPWLADEMRHYLTQLHPFAGKYPHASLFPGRPRRHYFDWAQPVSAANLYEHYLTPACKALRLGKVRFHDLRHSFATMNLSAGEHYMQVSKWMGHSSFVLTLTTYADYITEGEQPVPKVGRGVVSDDNVVAIQSKTAS